MKRTKLKIWLNNTWEDLFPETSAELVHTSKGSGKPLDVWLQDFSNTVDVLTGQIQSVEETADKALTLALGASVAKVFNSYSSMIAQLNVASSEDFVTGQNFLIRTLNIPDVWVYTKANTYKPFEYTTDEDFVAQLQNTVQVGWYILSPLETQKVNLSEYVKFTDYATENKAGVVYTPTGGWNGINIYNGIPQVVFASKPQIDEKKTALFPIVPANGDYFLRKSITTNTETLTDEEKTSACNWLGAVQKVSIQGQGTLLYGMSSKGEPQMIKVSSGENTFTRGGVPISSTNGAIYQKDVMPENTNGYENYTVPRKYIDNNFVAVGEPSGSYVLVYAQRKDGTIAKYILSDGIVSNSIPMRTSATKNFSVGPPQNDNECTNKAYVDNLPDNLTLTDDTQEDGTVTEGTKTKWQRWLGINSGGGSGGTGLFVHTYSYSGGDFKFKILTPIGTSIPFIGAFFEGCLGAGTSKAIQASVYYPLYPNNPKSRSWLPAYNIADDKGTTFICLRNNTSTGWYYFDVAADGPFDASEYVETIEPFTGGNM